MKLRNVLAALVAGTVFAVAACSDNPISAPAPQPQMHADLLGSVTSTLTATVNSVTGLLATCSNPSNITVSQTFDKNGGTMHIGAHTFTVPANALKEPTTITATLVRGSMNHIDFAPEGLHFKKSASLSMSYANCGLLPGLLPKHVAYTSDDVRTILELINATLNTSNKTVTAPIDHFSDYILAF